LPKVFIRLVIRAKKITKNLRLAPPELTLIVTFPLLSLIIYILQEKKIMALKGVKVLEIAGLAPAPYAGLILSDFGADVVRVDRTDASNTDNLARGKRSIAIDLKKSEGIDIFKRLIKEADVLIEPFRPGVMEKLGLGPEVLLKLNPRLIYARLTGFGQTGPYAQMAGHDINYIATSGILSFLGRSGENPIFPSNLLGDFAAGGMLCAMGVLLALIERSKSGQGQVVDSAMIDGTIYLGSFLMNMKSAGVWEKPRGQNMLDTGAHFYETYKTKDNKYLAVGAIERQFYKELLKGLGLDQAKTLPHQLDSNSWPMMKKRFADIFASKTRDEWSQIFDGTDACVTPILEPDEVFTHPHAKARGLMIPIKDADGTDSGTFEPAPAPKLSRTPGIQEGKTRPDIGEHTEEILLKYGFSQQQINQLLQAKVISKL